MFENVRDLSLGGVQWLQGLWMREGLTRLLLSGAGVPVDSCSGDKLRNVLKGPRMNMLPQAWLRCALQVAHSTLLWRDEAAEQQPAVRAKKVA